MTLTQPLRFLAMAAAMVSAFATQTNAQDPASILACEQFNAAVAEIDGAFVVSGLQAEETNLIDIGDFEPPVPNSTTRLQFVSADTPQLTLPMGTITRTSGLAFATSPDFLERQNITFLVLGSDGGAAEAFNFFNETYSLEPDASLGIACGFCLTSDSGFFNESPIEDGVVTFFDGDTQIGQATGPDFSFLAQPGETITRVDFADLRFAYDFQVAFCPDVTPELPPVVELSKQECLKAIAEEVGALADAATDDYEAYALNVACAALHFSAKDKFYEEDGNRLTAHGGNVFTGAAYAICYLEHTGVEGTEDIVDRIVEKLEEIVDCEIEYAIANGGTPRFIERAEDFAEAAEWIDEELDNPVVATIAYKLAWANAYFATY